MKHDVFHYILRGTYAVGFFLFLFSCQGEKTLYDPKVKEILEKNKLDFAIDKDYDFRVLVPLEDGNSENVWIVSQLKEFEGGSVREIFAPISSFQDSLPIDLIQSLMLDSYNNRYTGAWSLVLVPDTSDEYTLIFLSKIDARADEKFFLGALFEVAQVIANFRPSIEALLSK